MAVSQLFENGAYLTLMMPRKNGSAAWCKGEYSGYRSGCLTDGPGYILVSWILFCWISRLTSSRTLSKGGQGPTQPCMISIGYSFIRCKAVSLKVKLSLCFNWAPRHESVLGEWRYSFGHSRPLYRQGKSSQYTLDRRLGGPQSRSGHSGGEEKNSQPLSELEPPIIQPVAQCCTTELSWLQA
jgi:hypothetical protein